MPDAILGTPVEIPTVDGKVKVKLDPGTQPGKILRLKGKGVPDVNGYGKGDLLVNIQVYIPKEVSKEERKLVEKLNESPGFRPQQDETDSFFSKVKNMFE